ncbi:MAG TPA: excinuclease ABC subunit UvrC [Actinobacteria bacterium]|nr:excinuclease ABC subunit UvrC [Actinomycetota bacterium]
MKMALSVNLEKQLKIVPDKPGVYLFKNAKNYPIYIGKARSLKKRVRSYFQKPSSFSPKTLKLVEKIDSLDFFVTDNEIEALILESSLIKKHKPHYNVSLRDDKTYPYIGMSLKEDFPRIFATRDAHGKGFQYFGPYTKAYAMRDTLDVLRKIFPLRSCSNSRFKRAKNTSSPCLYYHIKMCTAPCVGVVSKEDYGELVKQVILFLKGRQDEVISVLKRQMRMAADKLEFEKASQLRDQIEAAKHVIGHQKVISGAKEDQDIIAIAMNENIASATILFVRDGKLIGSEDFALNQGEADENEILASFLKQFYSTATVIPKEIFLERDIDEKAIIETWLSQKRGRKVKIVVSQKGEKKRLVEMAARNASYALEFYKVRKKLKEEEIYRSLNELKEGLCLNSLPYRIEAFDISTIQGKESVGSMVVFKDSFPRKEWYRKFKVKRVEGLNDFAMIKEVVKRRFAQYLQERNKPASSFGQKPDLLVIDGGRSQLNAASAALNELGLDGIPVIALAKKKEEIYLPEVNQPISLPQHSRGLNLLRRIRDEAHRFAIGYHRDLRAKRMVESILDEVPGIGEKRKKKLVEHFGSSKEVAKAKVAELEGVLPAKIAQGVYSYLHAVKEKGEKR